MPSNYHPATSSLPNVPGHAPGLLPDVCPKCAPAPRAPRCLRLVERTNGIKLKATEQCQNPRLPGSDECAHHLGQAVADFRRLTESERDAA